MNVKVASLLPDVQHAYYPLMKNGVKSLCIDDVRVGVFDRNSIDNGVIEVFRACFSRPKPLQKSSDKGSDIKDDNS